MLGRLAEVLVSSSYVLAVLWNSSALVVELRFVVDSVDDFVGLLVVVIVGHEDNCQPKDASH